MTETNIIETERLLLREMNPGIFMEVMSTLSDEELVKFFGYRHVDDLERDKKSYEEGVSMYGKTMLYFHLIEKRSGNAFGWCGYHTWYTRHSRAELGYVINHENMRGKGYMKEALPSILQYGFETMKLHRIEALTSTTNDISIGLLESLGFVREGLLREHYCSNGKPEDSLIFSLLAKEFVPGATRQSILK
jgi:ribosomal-protein-alanine N-acetyltransferase